MTLSCTWHVVIHLHDHLGWSLRSKVESPISSEQAPGVDNAHNLRKVCYFHSYRPTHWSGFGKLEKLASLEMMKRRRRAYTPPFLKQHWSQQELSSIHPALFWKTRSYAALRAADLDWIVGPGYSSGGYISEKNHEKLTWNHEKPLKTMKNQPGTMKNHENSTLNHEKPTRNHEKPWKPMKNYEKPWKIMKNHEKTWKPTWNHKKTTWNNEKPWKPTRSHQKPTWNHEKPWKLTWAG